MISAVCRGEGTSGGEHRHDGMEDKLTPLLALFIISVNSGWEIGSVSFLCAQSAVTKFKC